MKQRFKIGDTLINLNWKAQNVVLMGTLIDIERLIILITADTRHDRNNALGKYHQIVASRNWGVLRGER